MATRSTAPTPSRSRLPLILLAVVGLCAAIAIGVSVASSGDDETAGTSTAGSADDAPGAEEGTGDTASGGLVEEQADEVTVTGGALDAYVAGVDDLAEGKPMPALSGTGLDGEPLTIGPDDGPAIIVFVAHWCPHCQREVPVIVDWLAGGGGDGVEMRSVSTAFAPAQGNWPSSEWLAREEWPVATLLDPTGSASLAAGQSAFPYFVVLDDAGEVVTRVEGELTPEQLDALADAAAGRA